jgi:hypothetical protein
VLAVVFVDDVVADDPALVDAHRAAALHRHGRRRVRARFDVVADRRAGDDAEAGRGSLAEAVAELVADHAAGDRADQRAGT